MKNEVRNVVSDADGVKDIWSWYSGRRLLCKLYRTFPAPAMGARFTVYGQASHADMLDDWHCSLQKRVMSRLIQIRQH